MLLTALADHRAAAALAFVVLIAALGLSAWLPRRLDGRRAALALAVLATLMLMALPWMPLATGLALAPATAALFGAALSRWPLAEPPPQPAAGPAAHTRPPTIETQPRTDRNTLGRYRIDGQIGRGAMGAVYLGHDPQIGRQVALKTLALSREFSGDSLADARQRFFHEAETAGRLQHPDIVTIFDAGEAQELAYIAMEYVKGHDLQRHAAPGQLLPVPQVLALVARVADALDYAHRQGVVHRDIKPANVMVDPDSGLVKVMDFGIAHITDASRTRTGVVLGTPSYMSPEQMAGRPVDGRSDLYSLGVMLFQLLTGTLPHQGDSMARLMYQIANEAAPDIRSMRADLPPALADVVALALQKRPEVRYADGRALAEDLRAIAAAHEGAGPPPESDEFEKTVTFARSDPRHNSGP